MEKQAGGQIKQHALTVSVPQEHMQLRLFCRAADQAAAFSIKSGDLCDAIDTIFLKQSGTVYVNRRARKKHVVRCLWAFLGSIWLLGSCQDLADAPASRATQ